MLKKSLYSVLLLVIVVLLTACQTDVVERQEEKNVETPDVGEMVPFSRGPSSPPSVKGPTADPGATDAPVINVGSDGDTPESVTEVEDIKITLPKEGE